MKLLHRLLPGWAYTRLIGSWDKDGLRKYAKNTWWMIVGRFALYPVSILVIASVARYLGPGGLGQLSYAQSIVGIIGTITALGIDQILVRDLILRPGKSNEILGTALGIQLFMSILAFIATVAALFILKTEHSKVIVILFAASTMITGPFGMGANLFSAKALSKYPTIISLSTRITIAILKLLGVFFAVPLVYFAVLFLVESALNASLTMYFCRRILHSTLSSWHFSFSMLTRLLHDSWPLLISATSVYLFARIDQVLLQHYMGSSTVGLYGATVQLTDTWTFAPTLIIGSLYPAVAGMYYTNNAEYSRRMKLLTGLALSIALTVGLGIILFAPFIVKVVYGDAFRGVVPILRIYTLYVPIAVGYAIVQNHLTTSNKTRVLVVIGIVGAVVNIALNILLIPGYGAVGATLATIIAGSIMITIPFLIYTVRRVPIIKNKLYG